LSGGSSQRFGKHAVSIFRADVLFSLSFTLPLSFEFRTFSNPTYLTRATDKKYYQKVKVLSSEVLVKKNTSKFNALDTIPYKT